MSVFWPDKLNPAPNVVTWIGRVLHWAGCAAALAACVFGFINVGRSFEIMLDHHPTGASLTLGFGIILIGLGVGVFFTSRAIRYAFSRE